MVGILLFDMWQEPRPGTKLICKSNMQHIISHQIDETKD